MKYPKTFKGILLKRYKRFLCDVEFENGDITTAHCVNTGSMKTCSEPGSIVYLTKSDNPKRKLKYTLEIVKSGRTFIGVNTSFANKLAEEGILNGSIRELSGYAGLKREVKYGENSRIDILLSNNNDKDLCYVEVKNVSMALNHTAYFPDSVTTRGLKHLNELLQMKKLGHRAVMLFVVQRADANVFTPAHFIDINYSQLLSQAHQKGLEILVYQCKITPKINQIEKGLPFHFDFI